MPKDVIVAREELKTTNGSKFEFEDKYRVFDEKSSFLFERRVRIVEVNDDEGFSTQFVLYEREKV